MPPSTRTTVLLISGMRDSHCRESVVKALERLPGVLKVRVDLYQAQASVVHVPKCSAELMIRCVVYAGYVAIVQETRSRSRRLGQKSDD